MAPLVRPTEVERQIGIEERIVVPRPIELFWIRPQQIAVSEREIRQRIDGFPLGEPPPEDRPEDLGGLPEPFLLRGGQADCRHVYKYTTNRIYSFARRAL